MSLEDKVLIRRFGSDNPALNDKCRECGERYGLHYGSECRISPFERGQIEERAVLGEWLDHAWLESNHKAIDFANSVIRQIARLKQGQRPEGS